MIDKLCQAMRFGYEVGYEVGKGGEPHPGESLPTFNTNARIAELVQERDKWREAHQQQFDELEAAQATIAALEAAAVDTKLVPGLRAQISSLEKQLEEVIELRDAYRSSRDDACKLADEANNKLLDLKGLDKFIKGVEVYDEPSDATLADDECGFTWCPVSPGMPGYLTVWSAGSTILGVRMLVRLDKTKLEEAFD